jgi:hypothetical protein
VASEQDQGQSPVIEVIDLPEMIKITEAEMEILETHLRDILISMLQDSDE